MKDVIISEDSSESTSELSSWSWSLSSESDEPDDVDISEVSTVSSWRVERSSNNPSPRFCSGKDEITMVYEISCGMYHLDVLLHSFGDVLNVDAIGILLNTL